ncbi:radical SAM protein [Oribacterium sp. FC2011]|uniref:radical SAM protein n=1 Tax=Oribacterium sp. FC2011 TaxID=1408311 RepID=UPI000679AC77|nr:radical SAM protein [Oribacterium sp. FC2011]
MKTYFDDYKDRQFYIWGRGRLYFRYMKVIASLNIKSVVDSNPEKWRCGDNREILDCISPQQMDISIAVIVAIEDTAEIKKITDCLDKRGTPWCHIKNIVDSVFLKKHKQKSLVGNDEKLVKFIDVMVPVASCNLQCKYCYLEQLNIDNKHLPSVYHDARYIRYSLRKERLGGTAFINLCGIGETMISDYLIPIVKELVEEGHYIQIVTNATMTKRINQLTNAGINKSHLFLKCSLHWNQLKEKGLLSQYAGNIKKIKDEGISFTIELVPEDDIVSEISEIKSYCLQSFGALPHVTVARNESYDDYRIDTSMSDDDYKKVWSVFESPLFEFKMNNREKNRYSDCYAGLWAGELNLATGDFYKCTNNPWICNIYENPEEPIPFEKVGARCALPYCFNCHAYLTLGLKPSVIAPTYLEMRDRVTIDGAHWILGDIRNIFSQKLYENNKRE